MIRRVLLLTALLCPWAGAYTVKPGDTLFSIARTYRTTVAQVQALNGLSGTSISVGQELRIPGEGSAPATPAFQPPPSSPGVGVRPPGQGGLPAPLPPSALRDTPDARLAGVDVRVPASLRMGQAFSVVLSGARAAQAKVRFPSEVGEDVREPDEVLTPTGAAGAYRVLGRVVLGKTTPVVYEVRVGDELLRGRIPVTGLDQRIQHLNLPPSVSGLLKDPDRPAEEKLVERAYAMRTPAVWTRPFAPALATVKPVSSSFGQPRTYTAGSAVAYHFGTDFMASSGTPVLAVNDGTVVMAGHYPVRGGLVVIDHGAGVTSLYFHQRRVVVKAGQKVVRGQKLGEVGSEGISSAPHLHLEIRVRGEGTNPVEWFGHLWPR